jgi:hypothetical protein
MRKWECGMRKQIAEGKEVTGVRGQMTEIGIRNDEA